MKIKARLARIDPDTVELVNFQRTWSNTINDYATMMADGTQPPPILAARVKRNAIFILDGFHRFEAARVAGRRIMAWVVRYHDVVRLAKSKFGGMPDLYWEMDEDIVCGTSCYRRE